jgi:CDP-diacylglycerol--glycerol-3-phosphate 3-phosphatidyltransferase
MLNVPIYLTLFRIVLIPVLVIVYYLPWPYAHFTAAFLFIIASLTDWLDGWLARKWDQSTPFGAFLDPVADKLMVVCALALLIEDFANPWFTVAAMIIIGREVLISALRQWMAELGKRGVVQVSAVAKVKTTLQMIAIIVLMANGPLLPQPLLWLGYLLFFIAAVLTLWSMIAYLKAAWVEFARGGDLPV